MSDHIVGIINPVMALIFAVGVYIIWNRDRTRTYLIGMAIAPVALGANYAFNHYLVASDPALARTLSSLMAVIAVVSLVWAVCERLDKRTPLKTWMIAGLACSSISLFADPKTDVTVWLLVINGYCGVVFAMGAQLLDDANSPEPMDRATVWIFALLAVQFFARPIIVYMVVGPIGSDAYRESAGHTIYLATGAISMLLLAGVLVGSAVVDLMKSIRQSNETDNLSGLLTRDRFEERAATMLARARSKRVPITAILADIDNFKSVNDLWGHPAGDQAIAAIGRVIGGTIRPTDLAGRVGGEEFCILVWDCTEESATRLAERLRVLFARQQHDGIGPNIRLTVSLGVSAWRPGEGYRNIYERADDALYRAKRNGRDRTVSHALGEIGEPGELAAFDEAAVGGAVVAIGNQREGRREAG